ncbi:MAG TPA: peptidoglycan-binding domain-containing protein [Feifaniaceae bacterium]|nr:peptidoglycan-binding domain-containing protein [Feifaniaceae bacterium]
MKRAVFLPFVFLFALLFMVKAEAATPSPFAGTQLIQYEDTGETVAMIQTRLRELGYFQFKPTGSFLSMTRSAVIEFQKNQVSDDGTPIIADGTVGEQSMSLLFSQKAARAAIPQEVHIPIGDRADGSQKKTGALTSWQDVKGQLSAGQTYTLTDFNTGATFNMVYTGGEQHAEMEAATANDATVYKDTFGGEYNYSKRPMLITINGAQVACSLQGQPHGADTVERNDMVGHACLYFNESKSHVGQLPDVEHINNVFTASGKT